MVYLAGVSGSASNARRVAAVHDFLDDHADVRIQILPGGVTFDDGYAAAPRVLDSSATAVLAFNDLLATGLMGALSDQGVRVPDEISVVGFDDIPFARYLTPPLTTASVPVAELGRHAWQRMWDLLNHRPAGHAIFLRPTDREPRQRGAGAARARLSHLIQPDRRLRGLAGRGPRRRALPGRRRGEYGAGPGARPAAAAGSAGRGRRGQRTPGRRADPATALVGRLRPGHHRLAAAPGRRTASASRASSVCTATAGCARSAPSSWSTSGPARVRAAVALRDRVLLRSRSGERARPSRLRGPGARHLLLG